MPNPARTIEVPLTHDLQLALEAAAAEWPGLSSGDLLAKLAVSAAEQIKAKRSRRETRRAALRASQGTVYYPPDYLEKLREDWPE